MTNILFIADVIGSPGREVVKALLPELRRRHELHFVICNCENSAAGYGVTRDTAQDLFAAGCDVLTGGNHLWDKKDSIPYIADEPRLVRPANLPPGTPGQGSGVFKAANGALVAVVNLIGRVFMREADCPFRTADAVLENLRRDAKIVFVDLHAEASAEKVAMGWHLDGRVSVLVGTHTHVQTADDRVLPKGTAFVSDAGMTGGFDSVIGMDRGAALRRFLTLMPERLQPAEGDMRLNAVLVRVDESTGRAESIQRLQVPYVRGAGAKGTWWGMSPSAESFLDELVTWRELGFLQCHVTPDTYDRWESLPAWARASLEKHATDPRPALYTPEQLERGETYDNLWNAAQQQLVRTGRMHNYLRMLWGKRVLEWTAHPKEALARLVHLNNKYALDGRDPNSYSGIFWVFGRYDRPWAPERRVFGSIRYMSSQNTARKFDVEPYLARYAT